MQRFSNVYLDSGALGREAIPTFSNVFPTSSQRFPYVLPTLEVLVGLGGARVLAAVEKGERLEGEGGGADGGEVAGGGHRLLGLGGAGRSLCSA